MLLTATSWSFWSFAAFRAIDELMPARYRGRIDIIINGSFWVGAVAGSGASLIFLDPNLFAPDVRIPTKSPGHSEMMSPRVPR